MIPLRSFGMTFSLVFLMMSVKVLLAEAQQQQRQQPIDTMPYTAMAGYTPTSKVAGIAALDLDQKELEHQLAGLHFERAKAIYERGGYAEPMARLELVDASSDSDVLLRPGSIVQGLNDGGDIVQGELININYSKNSAVQPTMIVEYQYEASDDQHNHAECQVGGLITIGADNRHGCFASEGTLHFVSVDNDDESSRKQPEYGYTYNPKQDNYNALTLQSISTRLQPILDGCPNCSFPDLEKYMAYYGSSDYGDMWIRSALRGKTTTYTSSNADFGSYKRKSRSAAIILGTQILNQWMFVVVKMEESLGRCEDKCDVACDESTVSWDEAVATYTGSLETADQKSDGLLLYSLADQMCSQFNSCGVDANQSSGQSHVNINIMSHFSEGKLLLQSGRCNQATIIKEKIVNLMQVPLIQLVLKIAYNRNYYPAAKEDDAEVDEMEGATVSAALIPLVKSCDENSVHALRDNLRLAPTSDIAVDFRSIKIALERTYQCLGVTCQAVGGLWETTQYAQHAAPCRDGVPSGSSNGGRNVGVSSITTICVLFLFLLALGALFKYGRRIENWHQHQQYCEESIADGYKDEIETTII